MEKKEEGKAEKFFKEFGKRLDQFMVEAKDAGQRMEADMKVKFEELKTAAEKVKKEAENKERWKEVEDGLKRAAAELEKTVKSAFKKKENS
jgi:hypothetical protein